MTRQEQIDAAETKAAHRAMEVFVEVLSTELEKVGGIDAVLDVMKASTHEHYALFYGSHKGVVKATYVFDDSPFAIAAALDRLRRPA